MSALPFWSRGTEFPLAKRNYLCCMICIRGVEGIYFWHATCAKTLNKRGQIGPTSLRSKVSSLQRLDTSCDFSAFRATTGSSEAELCSRSCSHEHFPLLLNSTDRWRHSEINRGLCLHGQALKCLQTYLYAANMPKTITAQLFTINRKLLIRQWLFYSKTFFFIVEWNSGVNVQQTKITPGNRISHHALT